MELIYVYMKKYRSFQDQEINLSGRFRVSVENGELVIEHNPKYQSIYPKNTANLNVIVGKNASGKTSLLEVIGNKRDTRFDNNEQIDKIKCSPLGPDIFNSEKQDPNLLTDYFFIYHIKDNHFAIEGNNYRVPELLLNNGNELPDRDYFRGKVWFLYPFYTDYSGKTKNVDSYQLIEEDYKPVSIHLFQTQDRQTGTFSKEPDTHDEPRIEISRRTTHLNSYSLFKQLKFLIKTMNDSEAELYRDPSYVLSCDFSAHLCNPDFFEESEKKEKFDQLFNISSNIKKKIRVFPYNQQFVFNYLYHQLRRLYLITQSEKPELDLAVFQISNILNDSIVGFSEIKQKLLNTVLDIAKDVQSDDEDYFTFVQKKLPLAIDALENVFKEVAEKGKNNSNNNLEYEIDRMTLNLYLTKNSKIDCFESLFREFLDVKFWEFSPLAPSLGSKKIEARIQHLSMGEQENLILFTAIDEQITFYAKDKEHFIFLFDEVEQSMHPEMCRQFVSTLLTFLKQYKGKTFQIIISTHSPFIISDIAKENVILLNRAAKQSGVQPLTSIEVPKFPTFGQNIHTILKNDFFLSHTCGEYALFLIRETAKFLDGDTNESPESFVNNTLCLQLKDGNGVEFIDHLIQGIGEPVLRNALEQRFKKWKARGLDEETQNKIHELENEIKRLVQGGKLID